MATQNGSAKELERVKELWVRLGLRDPAFPAQDMVCFGCKPENNTCAYAELRACAHKKGVENCGLCRGYPCAMLNAALDKSERLLSRSTTVCTPKEMDMLNKAFFSKRQNLERIHFEKG
jgi:hypothetical protein